MGVRRAMEADLDRIVELWEEMWALHAGRDPRIQATPAAPQVMRAWLEGDLAGDRAAVFVHEAGGRVVGFARAMLMENPPIVSNPRFGYVSDLAVESASRGGGIGSALVEACHGWLRERGAGHSEVNVAVTNPESRAFYERHGYRPFIDRMRLEL